MEKDDSSASKKNPIKFNSDLLNRTFTSRLKDPQTTSIFHINSENKFTNSFYNTEINNTSKISNFNQSILLTNKDFNEIDEKNLSFQSQIANNMENPKSRKPFDKLSFTSSSFKNDADSSKKAIEDTELSAKKTTNEEYSHSLNTEYLDETSSVNKTTLTENEKSFIKTRSQILSKETFEKAKLYNIQSDIDSIPFWIKFFSDIENNSLNSNSSYFKVSDKDRYVANLIEMVKRDSELYEATVKHEKVKKEVKHNIKSLLITEIDQELRNSSNNSNEINQNISTNDKIIKEENNLEENGEKEKLDINNSNSIDHNNDKINGKLCQILNLYDKLDEREIKLKNFYELRKAQPQNKKKRTPSKRNELNSNTLKKEISKNQQQSSNSLQINSDLEFKLIENLKFNDDNNDYIDEFKEINYEDVDFGCFTGQSIKRLLDIDKRLNKLNPSVYKTSINTHLKSLARDFIKDKNQRLKKINEKLASNKASENSKTNSKVTIFDVKLEKNEKVKYKDYLKEEKLKKEKQTKLETIDEQIKLINTEPVNEEKRQTLLKEIEELREKTDDCLLPFENEDHIDKKFEEIQERQRLKEYFIKKCEDNLKNTERIHKNQISQWKIELEKPYMELMSVIDEEYKENKILIERAEEINKNLNMTEMKLKDVEKRFDLIKQEADKYNKLWKEADEAFQPYDWGEDISEFDINLNDRPINEADNIKN